MCNIRSYDEHKSGLGNMSLLNSERKTEPSPALMLFSVCATDDQLAELFIREREAGWERAHLLHSSGLKLIAT